MDANGRRAKAGLNRVILGLTAACLIRVSSELPRPRRETPRKSTVGPELFDSVASVQRRGNSEELLHRASVLEAYGKLPLRFEPNRGAKDDPVKFLSRMDGYTLLLAPTEALFIRTSQVAGKKSWRAFRMELVGANPGAEVAGLEPLPGKTNYLIGNDPQRWSTDVPSYARVLHRSIYPGVDLVFYGDQSHLEYDFVVAPGAAPETIGLDFPGAHVEIAAAGDLVIRGDGEELRFRKPRIYQERDGAKQAIAGQYALRGGRRVGFEVAAYDKSRPLVIDPVLVYSTALSGSGGDQGRGIAVDSSGNAYVVGTTDSPDFPTVSPFQSSKRAPPSVIFVTKLNASGTDLVYSTYLGGTGFDQGDAIAVDSLGSAYVTGFTQSSDFPTTAGALQTSFGGGQRDGFVTKLNASGNGLVYSTYLGGASSDMGSGIAVDSSNSAYVTGWTYSTNFPSTSQALQTVPGDSRIGLVGDAFVSKLNPSGSALVHSTYLGGNDADAGGSIVVDGAGNSYVTGSTRSRNFPTTAGVVQATCASCPTRSDVFVTKLNATGSALLYSTYLGGGENDEGTGIALDPAGNVCVTGTTALGFPTVNPIQTGRFGSNFVAKLNGSASALVYSTYLGGTGAGGHPAIAVDDRGAAHVTGSAPFDEFPFVNAFQTGSRGDGGGFVAKLDAVGALVYSTFLGGNRGDLRSIALDRFGNAYVTGGEFSFDALVTMGAFQTFSRGFPDAFVAKIGPGNPAPLITSITPPVSGVGSPAFRLTVSGSNFLSGTVVQWNGASRPLLSSTTPVWSLTSLPAMFRSRERHK